MNVSVGVEFDRKILIIIFHSDVDEHEEKWASLFARHHVICGFGLLSFC